MRTKIGNLSTMSATAIMSLAREAATSLVKREEARTCSRMLAYENVAQMIGASAEWVRHFVRGYSSAKPDLVTGFNILHQYSLLCERVEKNRDNERAFDAALARKIDEIAGGPLGLVDSMAKPQTKAGIPETD